MWLPALCCSGKESPYEALHLCSLLELLPLLKRGLVKSKQMMFSFPWSYVHTISTATLVTTAFEQSLVCMFSCKRRRLKEKQNKLKSLGQAVLSLEPTLLLWNQSVFCRLMLVQADRSLSQ